jgi:hypothetical protein
MAIYRPELWGKAFEVMPWRKEGCTAGQVRVVMQRFFGNVGGETGGARNAVNSKTLIIRY